MIALFNFDLHNPHIGRLRGVKCRTLKLLLCYGLFKIINNHLLLITSNNRRTIRSLMCNRIIWFCTLMRANPILISSNNQRTRGSSICNGIIWFCALLHRKVHRCQLHLNPLQLCSSLIFRWKVLSPLPLDGGILSLQ